MKLRRETHLPTRFREDELLEPIRRRSTPSTPSTPALHCSTIPAPPVQRCGNEMLSSAPQIPYAGNERLDGEADRDILEWPDPVEWKDLAEGIQIVLLAELSRALTFRRAFDYLSLAPEERNELIRICRQEAILNHLEHKRMWTANARQLELLNRGVRDFESRHEVMEEEVYSRSLEPAMFIITNEQISKAKRLLSNSRVRERYRLLDMRNRGPMLPAVEDYNRSIAIFPTRVQLLSVMEALDTYLGSGTCWYMLGLEEEVDWDVEVKDFSMMKDSIPEKRKYEKHKAKRRKMKSSKGEVLAPDIGHSTSPDPKQTPRIPSTLRNIVVAERTNAAFPSSTGDESRSSTPATASSAAHNGGPKTISSTPGTLKRKLSSLGRNPFH